MKLNNESKELFVFLAIIAVIVGIFLTFYFRLTGLKVFIGVIMASLPFYISLNTFGLSEGEKFILALIFGLTLFPSFVYLLGFFVSFRMSIAIVFVVLTAISVLWSYTKSRKNRRLLINIK